MRRCTMMHRRTQLLPTSMQRGQLRLRLWKTSHELVLRRDRPWRTRHAARSMVLLPRRRLTIVRFHGLDIVSPRMTQAQRGEVHNTATGHEELRRQLGRKLVRCMPSMRRRPVRTCATKGARRDGSMAASAMAALRSRSRRHERRACALLRMARWKREIRGQLYRSILPSSRTR